MYSILVITTLVIGIFIYFKQGEKTQSAMAEQMLHREQLLSRSGALSLNNFTQIISDQVSAGSLDPAIESLDPQLSQTHLEIFLSGWENGPVSGVILTDANGDVIYGVDRHGPAGKGISVADRKYFIWAKTAKEGSVFIGEPIVSKIGFTTGMFIIPIASPVIKNGQFNGVFVASFLIDEATRQFLDPLKISNNTRIYLADKSGVILSASIQSLVGTNYYDYIKKLGGSENVPIQIFNDAVLSNKEGKIDMYLPDESKNDSLSRFLIAYSPVGIGTVNWVVVISNPADDAFLFTGPFYKDQIISLTFLIIVTLIFSIIGITSYRIEPEDKK